MKRVRISIDPSDLVLEIISIVIAILLAFSVNALAGRIRTRSDVHRAASAIADEMEANDRAIRTLRTRHVEKCAVLQELAERGRGRKITYTAYQNALDRIMPFAPPPVEETAWTLAQSGGLSANFAYVVRADVARIYDRQAEFGRIALLFAADFRPAVYTRDVDFFMVARNAASDCRELVRDEDRLDVDYAAEATKLRAI